MDLQRLILIARLADPQALEIDLAIDDRQLSAAASCVLLWLARRALGVRLGPGAEVGVRVGIPVCVGAVCAGILGGVGMSTDDRPRGCGDEQDDLPARLDLRARRRVLPYDEPVYPRLVPLDSLQRWPQPEPANSSDSSPGAQPFIPLDSHPASPRGDRLGRLDGSVVIVAHTPSDPEPARPASGFSLLFDAVRRGARTHHRGDACVTLSACVRLR